MFKSLLARLFADSLWCGEWLPPLPIPCPWLVTWFDEEEEWCAGE